MFKKNSTTNHDAAKVDQITAEHDQECGCDLLLINDHLIPHAFIDRVEDHFHGTVVHRGVVMSVREVCGEDFWNELDIREQQVVGHVLMMLIYEGRVALCPPKEH